MKKIEILDAGYVNNVVEVILLLTKLKKKFKLRFIVNNNKLEKIILDINMLEFIDFVEEQGEDIAEYFDEIQQRFSKFKFPYYKIDEMYISDFINVYS